MAEKKTSGALGGIINPHSPVDINVDNSSFIEDGTGLINPTEQLVESAMMDARTPDEARNVIDVANVFDNTIKQSKNLLTKEKEVTKKTINALSNLKLDDWQNRNYQFSGSDLNMGLFNSFANLPADQRQKVLDELNTSVKNDRRNAVEPAIEALGVESYFPSKGFNINVGTYSGKVLGNVPIFVAGGGQLPFALQDARKRALEKQAKEKADLNDKLSKLNIDTSPQYQAQFNELSFNTINSYLEKFGWDATKMYDGKTRLSRMAIDDITRLEAQAKEIMYVDKIAASVKKDLQDGNYVPPDTINLLTDWEAGKLNLKEFLGKGGKMSELARKMKSYDNITKRTDELSKTVNEQGMTIRPLNPKRMTTDSEYVTDAGDSLKYKKGMGYDMYLSVIGKYYDPKQFKELIDNEWNNNNFYKGETPEEEQELKGQFAGLMASKIGSKIEVSDIKTVSTDETERRKLSFEMAKDRRSREQYYDTADKESLSAGNSARNIIDSALKSGKNLTSKEKGQIYMNEYSKRGLDPYQDKYGNWVAGHQGFIIHLAGQKDAEGKEKKYVLNTNRQTGKVNVLYYDKRTGKQVQAKIPLSKYSENPSLYKDPKTKRNFTPQQVEDLRYANSLDKIDLDVDIQYGYDAVEDPKTGRMYPSDVTNIKGKRATMITSRGTFQVPVENASGSGGFLDALTKTASAGKTRKSSVSIEYSVNGSSDINKATLGTIKTEDTIQLQKIVD
jgi:hypothetical protein